MLQLLHENYLRNQIVVHHKMLFFFPLTEKKDQIYLAFFLPVKIHWNKCVIEIDCTFRNKFDYTYSCFRNNL